LGVGVSVDWVDAARDGSRRGRESVTVQDPFYAWPASGRAWSLTMWTGISVSLLPRTYIWKQTQAVGP